MVADPGPLRILVWNENIHDRSDERVRVLYPDGIHGAIANGLTERLGDAVTVGTAMLEQPEHGLPASILNETDVLLWWGHVGHGRVEDAVVDRVQQRVLAGMGLVVLHSGHESKIFRRLMGTTCSLRWREADEREVVWNVNPGHPIAVDIPEVFVIPQQEMYGEYFDIPQPDELVFLSSFGGGEVFRSGCCFTRGSGRIFYFSPGHETYPVYHHPVVLDVLANGVLWAAPLSSVLPAAPMSTNSPMGWFNRDHQL